MRPQYESYTRSIERIFTAGRLGRARFSQRIRELPSVTLFRRSNLTDVRFSRSTRFLQERPMKNKVVLVTGANGGLGRHVTCAFLDSAANVIGTARQIQQTDFNCANFTAIPGELSCRDGAARLVDEVMARFGRLDVVVHTVGGFAGGTSIVDTDESAFTRMIDVNLYSVLHALQATIPALRKSRDGRFIAIGSRAAVEPGAGVGAYSASKAAMVSLVKTAALENKDAGLRANVILPGTMDTPANRKSLPNADYSKWVQPEAVASLIVWLAGDAGTNVNGAVIPVYGNDD